MTVDQKILIVLYKFYMKKEFKVTYEDLIVACFKEFPDTFSLKNYREYPDSNSINKKIYDSLKPKGLIVIKNLVISLSNHGIETSSKLFDYINTNTTTSLKTLTSKEKTELKRLVSTKGFEFYLTDNEYEILDIDVYDFFQISVRTKKSDIKNRVSIINALLEKSLNLNPNDDLNNLITYKNKLINLIEVV